ncbi:MAG: hypothetical protein ABID61_05150 [Candidatus Micrarchaeota archaeon]
MRLFILTLLVFGMVLTGCFSPPPEQNDTNSSTNDTITPPVVKNPSFVITSPISDEVFIIQGTTYDVTLVLTTQNLVLKQPGATPKQGEGHFRVTVDSEQPITVTSKNYLIPSLGIGEHVITIELLTNDKKSYGSSKQVMFTIEKEKILSYDPQDYTVTIKDFSYTPDDLTVKVSDRVTFVNTGNFPRSATCFINGNEIFDTNVLGKGQNATLVMDQIMTCEYYSVTHPIMKGKIKVESNGVEN